MINPQRVSTVKTAPQTPLGSSYRDENGKKYRYIKASETIAKGAALIALLGVVDLVCEASSGKVLNDSGAFAGLTLNGYFVKINAGANSINQAPNRIVGNTDDLCTMEDAWVAALTTSEDYVVYHPWIVENTDATGEVVSGIAMQAMVAGDYGWMQVEGDCEEVNVNGSSAAISNFEMLVPSATPRELTGNAGTETADIVTRVKALIPTAIQQKIPCMLKCE